MSPKLSRKGLQVAFANGAGEQVTCGTLPASLQKFVVLMLLCFRSVAWCSPSVPRPPPVLLYHPTIRTTAVARSPLPLPPRRACSRPIRATCMRCVQATHRALAEHAKQDPYGAFHIPAHCPQFGTAAAATAANGGSSRSTAFRAGALSPQSERVKASHTCFVLQMIPYNLLEF